LPLPRIAQAGGKVAAWGTKLCVVLLVIVNAHYVVDITDGCKAVSIKIGHDR